MSNHAPYGPLAQLKHHLISICRAGDVPRYLPVTAAKCYTTENTFISIGIATRDGRAFFSLSVDSR